MLPFVAVVQALAAAWVEHAVLVQVVVLVEVLVEVVVLVVGLVEVVVLGEVIVLVGLVVEEWTWRWVDGLETGLVYWQIGSVEARQTLRLA